MQVELRGLDPNMIPHLLQLEGAQHISRDTVEQFALHNISYQILAGSLAPQKSEWSWTLRVCTAAYASMDLPPHYCWGREGLCPAFLGGHLPTTSSKTSTTFTAHSGDGGILHLSTCSTQGPSVCTLGLG